LLRRLYEAKEGVPAQFTLKQEQRYIKIVRSQSTLASQGICVVDKPLSKDSPNAAVAITDVGSTDTPEASTQDKSTDSISISGTIKLPKSVQPATPAPNPSNGQNTTNGAPSSTNGQSSAPTKKKGST